VEKYTLNDRANCPAQGVHLTRNTGTYRVVGRNKVIIRPKGAPKGVFMEGAATISRETITLIDNKEAGVNGFAVLIKQ